MASQPPILLLHGALYTKEEFAPLAGEMSAWATVHSLNFPGHGGMPIPDDSFSMGYFAESVLEYLRDAGLERVNIFGYSMGGYVGLYLARHYPEYVNRLCTLGTKLQWDEGTASREVGMLNPEKILEKVPQFAEVLIKRHGEEDWRTLMEKTAGLLQGLGRGEGLTPDDFSQVTTPVRLGLGDRDMMISIEETVERYRQLPNGELLILPGTPHQLERVYVGRLHHELREFFGVEIEEKV